MFVIIILDFWCIIVGLIVDILWVVLQNECVQFGLLWLRFLFNIKGVKVFYNWFLFGVIQEFYGYFRFFERVFKYIELQIFICYLEQSYLIVIFKVILIGEECLYYCVLVRLLMLFFIFSSLSDY